MLIGRPPDASLRGWAALLAPQDDATATLLDALAGEQRLRFLVGKHGLALVGSAPSLRWTGLAAAGSLHVPAAETGTVLRRWGESVEGVPPPLALRDFVLDWSRPVVMGVVNVTPDSFSDGGKFFEPAAGDRAWPATRGGGCGHSGRRG